MAQRTNSNIQFQLRICQLQQECSIDGMMYEFLSVLLETDRVQPGRHIGDWRRNVRIS